MFSNQSILLDRLGLLSPILRLGHATMSSFYSNYYIPLYIQKLWEIFLRIINAYSQAVAYSILYGTYIPG